MARLLFNLYAFAALLFGGLIGLFGAYGACLPIWGSHIFDTALGNPPDRSHPAFWLSLALLLPSMLVGCFGALFLFILPVAFRFPMAGRDAASHPSEIRFLRRYAERLLHFTRPHDENSGRG